MKPRAVTLFMYNVHRYESTSNNSPTVGLIAQTGRFDFSLTLLVDREGKVRGKSEPIVNYQKLNELYY